MVLMAQLLRLEEKKRIYSYLFHIAILGIISIFTIAYTHPINPQSDIVWYWWALTILFGSPVIVSLIIISIQNLIEITKQKNQY